MRDQRICLAPRRSGADHRHYDANDRQAAASRPVSGKLEPDFDDRQGQVYRAPSQAGPGNDINAGSSGFQKAPTRGPASLVARCFLRAEHQLSDAQARSMRTPTMTRIVARTGRSTLSGTRALRWLPKKMPGREPMTSCRQRRASTGDTEG